MIAANVDVLLRTGTRGARFLLGFLRILLGCFLNGLRLNFAVVAEKCFGRTEFDEWTPCAMGRSGYRTDHHMCVLPVALIISHTQVSRLDDDTCSASGDDESKHDVCLKNSAKSVCSSQRTYSSKASASMERAPSPLCWAGSKVSSSSVSLRMLFCLS